MGAAIAGIGHNSAAFGEDEPSPKKKDRIVPEEHALRAKAAALVIAVRWDKKYKSVAGTRQSESGRMLRFALFHYLRGRDYPVWMVSRIFDDIDKKEVGFEDKSAGEWAARNPQYDHDIEALTDGLDALLDCDIERLVRMIEGMEHLLRIKTERFVEISSSELAADVAAREAIERAREAAKLLEKNAPKEKPKKLTTAQKEAERISAKQQASALAEFRDRAVRLCEAIIAKGEADDATKDSRGYAKKARRALEEIRGAGVIAKGERAPQGDQGKPLRLEATRTRRAFQEVTGKPWREDLVHKEPAKVKRAKSA